MDHLIKFLNKEYVGRFGIGGKEKTNLRAKEISGPEIKYRSNRLGFRSKELKKFDSNNINIIYSGCSNTWGEGVFEEEVCDHCSCKTTVVNNLLESQTSFEE